MFIMHRVSLVAAVVVVVVGDDDDSDDNDDDDDDDGSNISSLPNSSPWSQTRHSVQVSC